MDELADAALEIELGYRRRLAGLRGLPRDRRAAAIQAAGEWRAGALKALQERRVSARHGRRKEQRLRREAQRPAPPWERRRPGENFM